MTDRFILSNVKRLPLFSRLDDQQTEWVAEAMQLLRFEPGEFIFRQGEAPPGIMLLISGRGSLIQRGPDGLDRLLGTVSPNEYLNETALFNETAALATLRADETSVILFLGRQEMKNLLAYHPEIRNALVVPEAPPPVAKTFDEQRDNEVTLLETRRHSWVFVRRVATTVLLIMVVWIFSILIGNNAPGFPSGWIAFLGTVFMGGWVAYSYAEWHNDQLIITDRRVLNIQRSIIGFRKSVSEIPLEGIQEVTVDLPQLTDFFGRILGYGTIVIKTAGDNITMRLDCIPHPQTIQQLIFDNRKRHQDNIAAEARDAARGAIKGEINKFLGVTPKAPAGTSVSSGHTSSPGLFSLKYTNDKGDTVYRKHHIIWMSLVIVPGMVVLGGIILLFLGFAGVFLPLLLIIGGGIWFYLADWDWRNDMYIISDKTIVIIHKRPLWLADQKDQILLAQVDNVIANTKGLINSLMHIGEVRIMLTGSEKNAKLFTWVYQPGEIQQEISRRQSHAEAAKQQAEAERQRQAIVEYLSVYHESVGGGTALPVANAAPPTAPVPTQPTAPPSNLPQVLPSRIRDRSRPPGIPRALPPQG